MRWLARIMRRKRSDVRPAEQRSMTPADAADLENARQAREQVERDIETARSRWPTVLMTVARLREIRENNHIADDLHLIFTSRRRG